MKKPYLLIVAVLVLALSIVPFGFSASVDAADKPITKIKIGGGRVGDPWYILSEGLANFINKGSKWLRATVVATPGITGNFELAKRNPKEYMMIGEMSNFHQMPKDPYGKAHNYYDKTRFISIATSLTTVWVTYDKNIKTGKDFAGKKVNISRKAAARVVPDAQILKEWGVWDKIKVVNSGFGGMKRSLKDGLVDACLMIVDHIYPFEFNKGSFITDMETKGPIYYISTAPEITNKMRQTCCSSISVRIPAKSLDPKTQPNEIYGWALPMFFGADERMDNNIVHEVTRIIWENAGKFEKWHPQGRHMTKEFIPAMPMDKKFVHAGAKKYYDEQGVKLTFLGDLLK